MLITIMALQCDITEHAFPLLLNFISLNTNAAFLLSMSACDFDFSCTK